MAMTPQEAAKRVLAGPGDLIIPQITSNGSGRDVLVAQYIVAIETLRLGLTALQNTTPHGRDYATTDILLMALEAHRSRTKVVDKIIADLTTIAEAIR
jgi:hypothetical protein